jgi:N-acetylneuraminate synthase
MVDDAKKAGCEVCKFQSHVIEDEMIPEAKNVIPGNTNVSIWEVMERCALSEEAELQLKLRVEQLGMIFLSTPFSRAAADRLESMNVCAYKIGSGECNNYPLVEHIAAFGKPVFLSTGMNDVSSIKPAVKILRDYNVPFCLMHCTSIYPTPYSKVNLGALDVLAAEFPDAVLGLSDHSKGIWTCIGACARGAVVLEKHYVSDKTWPGPDVDVSIDPKELSDLKLASIAVWEASKGKEKCIFPEEQITIDFAYSCVVTISPVAAGEVFSLQNIWCKRPGTGQILAKKFQDILGKVSRADIPADVHLKWADVDDVKN